MRTRAVDRIFKPKKRLMAMRYPLSLALQTTLAPTEPTCYSQAVNSPNWRTAMALEFEAFQKQGTLSLVPAKPGYNVIGSKWVFKIKQKSDGTIERYKARQVAKGFYQ